MVPKKCFRDELGRLRIAFHLKSEDWVVWVEFAGPWLDRPALRGKEETSKRWKKLQSGPL